jgi:hypothetical protein
MKRIRLEVIFKYDGHRFGENELTFHLRRAIGEYFSRLFEDDDEDGIQLEDVLIYHENSINVHGGNTQG